MSYISEVLADAPAAFWPLNETSGTAGANIANARASTSPASYVGSPTMGATGLISTNYAVETTSTSHVILPLPSLGTLISLELWMQYVSGSTPFFRDNVSSGGWYFDISGTNPVVSVAGVAHTISSVTSASLKDGARHHWVLTVAHGTAAVTKLYLDKVLVDTWPDAPDADGSSFASTFVLGKDGVTTAHSPTVAAAVAIYDKVLSAVRVAAHFDAADDYVLGTARVTTAALPAPITHPGLAVATVTALPLTQITGPTPTRSSWSGGIQVATDGAVDYDQPIDPGPTTTAPAYSQVQALVVDSATTTGNRTVPSVRLVAKDRADYRITVGGVDVTWIDGVRTPLPTYGLVSPLRYGSGSLNFPQMHAAFERPGVGRWSFLKKFAKVKVQRVSAGAVVATDYIGFISNDPRSARDYTAVLGGEATGTAATLDRPMPIFPGTTDIGTQVMRTIQHQLRLPTANEPETGIQVMETGGGSQLDFLTEILAKSTQRDGVQWTVEPNSQGAYRMQQKDLTTIDATVYIDGFRVVESLTRDFTEEPNRVWAQGVDPDGKRIRFSVIPGMVSAKGAFPGSTLHPGDTGDDVTAIIWRLNFTSWLDEPPFGLEWTTDPDDPVTAAIEDVQDDAGLSVTGNVNADTWQAIFRGEAQSLRGAQQRPAAQRKFTQAFLRDATGNILGPNPLYDRSRKVVDASINVPGFTRRKLQKWAGHEIADPDVANWVGTITVTTGAVIDGVHNPGDPLTSSSVRDARSLKPGHNILARNWDGAAGTLFHISGVNVSADSVELTVDTRARDTMKVWEVIGRNRESRIRADRQWIAQNRRSGQRDDTSAFYDGGPFGKIERTFCPGNRWTIIETPAGNSGTLQKIILATDSDQALFAYGIFGHEVGPGRLANLIGDPLTKAGTKNWQHQQKTLTEDLWMIDSNGGMTDGVREFCGYWPEHVDPNDTVRKSGSADAATDVITINGHGYSNGDEVRFASTPSGLTADAYYVISATANTFQVSENPGGAVADITADATGVAVEKQNYPPVTGEYRNHSPIAYFCKGAPVLRIAVYPDRDCHVQGGRALWLLLDDAAG